MLRREASTTSASIIVFIKSTHDIGRSLISLDIWASGQLERDNGSVESTITDDGDFSCLLKYAYLVGFDYTLDGTPIAHFFF